MKKIILILVVAFLVGAGAYWFLQWVKYPYPNELDLEGWNPLGGIKLDAENEEIDFISEEMSEIEIDIKDNKNTLVAALYDVTGGTSSGVGYVLRTDNTLSHIVEADLPDPSGNNQYEGWLVRQNPLSFFSTGVLEKTNGMYLLKYEQTELSEEHNLVVITEETAIDETPEKHIIEGLAE